MVVFACASHLSILLALYFATRFAGDEFERALVWSAGVLCFSIFASTAMKVIRKRFEW